MPARPQLTPEQLTEARRGYEAGGTFQSLADQHGLAEATMRRMLRAVGVEPRPRGTAPRDLPVELILADHDGGMSAREIARKHGVGAHNQITAVLRANGREPHHRGRSKGNRAVVLGRDVTKNAHPLATVLWPATAITPAKRRVGANHVQLRARRWARPRRAPDHPMWGYTTTAVRPVMITRW